MTYRRAADAFRRRDLQALAETIHDDVRWHFPGKSWVAREIQGREALLGFLRELTTRTINTFFLEDVRIAGTDHHLVAVQRFGATHGGQTQKFEAVSIMRFEDGRQIERWFHLVNLEAFDAFFMKFD
jgi:ketosteroid isomerase-like protein